METNPPSPPPSLTPPTLEYSKRPALAAVSRHRGKLILLALLLAIAIPIWRHWQPLKHRVMWQYWFHQAMQHRMPEKSVDLIVNDPAKAAAAMSSDPGYLLFGFGSPSQGAQAVYVPAAYRELLRFDPRLRLTGNSGDAVAFIGVLKRPDGTPRLVVVHGTGGITGNILQRVGVLVLPLPNWTDPPPSLTPTPPSGLRVYSGPMPTATRLRSGVADPADPSHVVFEFEAGPSGQPFVRGNAARPPSWTVSATGVIDAHLKDDDSIAFRLSSFTGNDPNMRVGPAVKSGDWQTLQAENEKSQQRLGGNFWRSGSPPLTPPPIRPAAPGRPDGR